MLNLFYLTFSRLSPCVLLYILTVVPAIWVLESDRLDRYRQSVRTFGVASSTPADYKIPGVMILSNKYTSIVYNSTSMEFILNTTLTNLSSV